MANVLNGSVCALLVLVLVYSTNLSRGKNLHGSYIFKRDTNKSEITCSNGDFLYEWEVCDGWRDCEDGSDETAELCSQKACKRQFRCEYGGCVTMREVCDGKYDCWDHSDEVGCNGTGRCLYATSKCDAKYYGDVTLYRTTSKREATITHECRVGQNTVRVQYVCREDCSSLHNKTLMCERWSERMREEFYCINGQKIKGMLTCDGYEDCKDGSDEATELCSTKTCTKNQARCDYGGCIQRNEWCDGRYHCRDNSDELRCKNNSLTQVVPTTPQTPHTPSCILPSPPSHGNYLGYSSRCSGNTSDCTAKPGTLVDNGWVLRYSCHDGYSLDRDPGFSVCDNGTWINKVECVKLCPPLTSKSVTVTCSYQDVMVVCDSPMRPGTKATVGCNTFYRPAYTPEYNTLYCLDNGEWTHPLFQCSPVCGVPQGPLKPLIVNGQATKRGEYPWLAGIYYQTSGRFEHICGGTLITPHVFLTAAHCVVKEPRAQPLHPSELKVGLGKYYRDIDQGEESSVISLVREVIVRSQYVGRQSNYAQDIGLLDLVADVTMTAYVMQCADWASSWHVREVIVRSQYVGRQSNYAQDIGLLDLVADVTITAYVMPACIDWTNSFKPDSNAIGVVAGWGTTEEGKTSSEVLAASLTFIKYQDCFRMLRASKKGLLNQDKFCAGSINGSRVDSGDSGGGLTFIHNEQHFVIGIVSTKIIDETTFTLFTDITSIDHMRWLESQNNRLISIHRQL